LLPAAKPRHDSGSSTRGHICGRKGGRSFEDQHFRFANIENVTRRVWIVAASRKRYKWQTSEEGDSVFYDSFVFVLKKLPTVRRGNIWNYSSG